MRVAILPTGRTEWHDLPRCLARLFPDHDFYCLPTPEEVLSYPDLPPYEGFTSVALTPQHIQNPPESALALIQRAAQEALGDRRHEPADHVLIIDDVELFNHSAQGLQLIVEVMRSAARAHLHEINPRFEPRTRDTLKDKVSLHLVSPMIEAWFFADPQSLRLAGVPDLSQVSFSTQTDPEDFVTEDLAYLAATEQDCTALSALAPPRRKKNRPKWFGSLPRERHPKRYLQWLCRDEALCTCTHYSEVEGGAEALAQIDWSCLLARPIEHMQLLRALVEDLSDRLGATTLTAITPSQLTSNAPTSLSQAPRDAVLRNI